MRKRGASDATALPYAPFTALAAVQTTASGGVCREPARNQLVQRQVSEKAALELRTHASRLHSRAGARAPLILIAFAGSLFSTFEKKILVCSGAPFATDARLLFGLVPAAQKLLRRLLVAPLHVAHARN